ncbi:rhodanese-like domain-containing protein [Brevibacillus ginsengisoli]|uniref:rhodanese-like domain-containing protein n=1 Tax=Brevibacillus ginsengisoli TaxID=363854 RepID=UPI003CF2FA08
MDWIQYVILGLLVVFIMRKLMPVKGLKNLTQEDVMKLQQKRNEVVFIDVREAFEYKSGHIQSFQNVPLSTLEKRLNEIDRDKSIVLTCKSGMRSRQAAKVLLKYGFTKVSHLQSGLSGWTGSLVK